jgi:uncharacterized membrane-anchored protein
MARVAYANGEADEARAWVARGVAAPQEPDWSDLDPEGRAFAYARDDWARLTVSYAETGELIHPRFERRERTMSELPRTAVGLCRIHALRAGGRDRRGADADSRRPRNRPGNRPRRVRSRPRRRSPKPTVRPLVATRVHADAWQAALAPLNRPLLAPGR